jgi:hypothetical protein
MRSRVVAVLIGLGLGTAPVPVVAAAAKRSPKASIACVYGRIGGRTKCLARGEFCARRYERQYERYGFSCSKLDRRGNWHLQ